MSNVINIKPEHKEFPGKELIAKALEEERLNLLHGLDDKECHVALEMYVRQLEEKYCLTF